MSTLNERLRALPSLDKLASSAAAQQLIVSYGRDATLDALRYVLEETRAALRSTETLSVDSESLIERAQEALKSRFRPSLRPVINATGVIIHTTLGRAPLSEAAQQAMLDAASGYSNLEFDLDSGKRGSRLVHAGTLLAEITGAEAALVVNNNAAATVLMLAELAQGREVIVSRGQLVEIGGGVRVPDIMRQSGAKLVEVGTTNRTRASDFESAITTETDMLLRVHSSNFKQIGFVEETPLAEMAEIAHRHGLLLGDDLGSGALIDTSRFGLAPEPTPQASLLAGADVICFSGDKLLGGPQAGILIGTRAIIDRLKKHPLARAIRADKLCLAALTATLDHYRRGEAFEKIPVLWMIARPLEDLRTLAETWAAQLNRERSIASVVDGQSTVGGGSLPGETLPTALLALDIAHPDDFAARLRQGNPAIVARILDQRVVFDPRTILPHQTQVFMDALQASLARL
ncbi:MAG: L-seryl-tRNA(Sec) selenium transferase [bacterium]|nr:L-seryl-tRNA(Sec) selenium transferase [bacterium]